MKVRKVLWFLLAVSGMTSAQMQPQRVAEYHYPLQIMDEQKTTTVQIMTATAGSMDKYLKATLRRPFRGCPELEQTFIGYFYIRRPYRDIELEGLEALPAGPSTIYRMRDRNTLLAMQYPICYLRERGLTPGEFGVLVAQMREAYMMTKEMPRPPGLANDHFFWKADAWYGQ